MSSRTAPSDDDCASGATARLFTALWPDPSLRAQLAALRDAWHWPASARPVADDNLHVTLHFIGSFAREGIEALALRLGKVDLPALDLQAEGAAIWRGGIAVLTLRGDAAIDALHADIGSAVREFGIALDPRPFAPHVTLARKAAGAQPPAELADLEWRASGFVLAESRPGPPADYRVLATWDGSGGA